MNSPSLTVTGLVLLLVSSTVKADEFITDAEVIDSEPITSIRQHRSLAAECAIKPSGLDLVGLLNWDLGTGQCAVVERQEFVTGYRVFYRWDDRVFSQVMDRKPGKWIPVRIRVD